MAVLVACLAPADGFLLAALRTSRAGRATPAVRLMADKYDAGFTAWGTPFDKFGSAPHTIGKYDRIDMARAFDLPTWRDIEECLVDAEGLDEIAMCKDDSPPVASAQTHSVLDDAVASLSTFFNRMVNGDLKVDVEECLVDAENALEQQACRA